MDILRAAVAVVLLGLAALLLVPGPPEKPGVTWADLIAPLAVGEPLGRGFVLSPPRRGEAHDVVYVARRSAAPSQAEGRVEIHVVDRGRWNGVPETRSFGIAWEVPPRGSSIITSPEESGAVTRLLFDAIATNDTGFTSVDSIPLTAEPAAPMIVRVLDRLASPRGKIAAITTSLALILLIALPSGPPLVALILFAISLAIRVPVIDLPFAHDQDVQRMLTGNSSLTDIATGVGLQDRHPPLYFFILHCAQWFGQSEAIGRAPAVLAGALAAPALVIASVAMVGRATAATAIAGLAVAISPQLVARSREVSGIPLYGLLLLVAAASLVAACRRATLPRRLTLAASHTLSLFTYYLAPFVVAAHAGALFWRRPTGNVARAFISGVVAGTPALILGIATLLRDWSARDVARAFPAIAWGEHNPIQMGVEMAQIAVDAFGPILLAAVLIAALVGLRSRDFATIVPALGVLATFFAVALLSPIARVQSYYFTSALPLAALLLAVVPAHVGRWTGYAWTALLIIAIGFTTAPLAAANRTIYLPDSDAFMPRFAAAIMDRPEQTVVTIAHYDKTLLAYYLARANDRSINWRNWEASAKKIIPLVKVHALRIGAASKLVAELDHIIAEGAALVIERDAVTIPEIQRRLDACEILLAAPTGRLKLCRG